MITDEMIAAAEAAVAEARSHPQLSDLADRDYAEAADVERAVRVAERSRRVRVAQQRVDALQAARVRQEQAVTDHEAAERAEGKRIRGIERSLAGSKDRLAAASVAAVEALGALHDAATEHDSLVVQSAGELRAAGLTARCVDGDEVIDFDTGGTAADGLVLGTRWWTRVDSDASVQRALYGAVRAKTGDYWGLAGSLRYDPGVRKLEDHSAGLLAGAPLPEPFVPAVDPVMAELRRVQQEVLASMGAEVVMSDSDRDDLLRRRRGEAKAESARRARMADEWPARRAELVAKVGEPRVLEVEEQLFPGGVVAL